MFETLLDNTRTVPFTPNAAVPAFGVMYVTGVTTREGQMVLQTKKPDGLCFGEIMAINGPSAVASGAYGSCVMAGDVPMRALVNSSETVATGDVCGPKSGQWDLYKDFPGLIAFDAEDSNDLAWVRLDPDPSIDFELKNNLPASGTVSAGQQATAYRLKPNDTVDTATEFEVYDERGIYRGRKNGRYSSPHDRGSKGVARWNRVQGRLSIVSMTPHALQIMGTINESSGVEKTDSSFNIDNVYVMQPPGAIITDTDPASSSFGIANREFAGDDNDYMIATWDENYYDWRALDVMCPS